MAAINALRDGATGLSSDGFSSASASCGCFAARCAMAACNALRDGATGLSAGASAFGVLRRTTNPEPPNSFAMSITDFLLGVSADSFLTAPSALGAPPSLLAKDARCSLLSALGSRFLDAGSGGATGSTDPDGGDGASFMMALAQR